MCWLKNVADHATESSWIRVWWRQGAWLSLTHTAGTSVELGWIFEVVGGLERV